jgi:hypothetical protein
VTLPAKVAGSPSTTYNANNPQSKFNGASLSYDTNGNLTGDGINTYTWDGRNHLTQIAPRRTTPATSPMMASGDGASSERRSRSVLTIYFRHAASRARPGAIASQQPRGR